MWINLLMKLKSILDDFASGLSIFLVQTQLATKIFLFCQGTHICFLLILFCRVSLLVAEGIFRAQFLELEKENSQANGVSSFVSGRSVPMRQKSYFF